MRHAADRFPEDALFSEGAWELILREILTLLKPYLEAESDVMIEETIFAVVKDSKETMAQYVTRKVNKHRELLASLGQQKTECSVCHRVSYASKDFPDEI